MDNSGFELFTDLCLADFLITSGVVTKIRYDGLDKPQDYLDEINQFSSG